MICITGAYGGYGVEVAHTLASQGHDLLLCGRKEELLKSLANELLDKWDSSVCTLPLDLSSNSSITQFESALNSSEIERIDALIHCSGIGHRLHKSLELNESDYLSQLQVNSYAPYLLTRQLAPWLRRGEKKKVIFISSVSALAHIAQQAAYSISKRSLDQLVDQIQKEFSDLQISTLWPGLTDTNMVGTHWRRMPILPPSHIAQCIAKVISSNFHIREMVVLSSIQKAPNYIHYLVDKK